MKKFINISSILVIIVGLGLIVAGVVAAVYTYQNVAREKIVTPKDASIPNAAVRDPLTLKAQADIIRKHTLESTKEKTYAQMPQKVQKVDASGSAVLDKDGKPVMEANTARNIWITATTLTTALNLGIMAYMLAGFAILFGVVLIWLGIVVRSFNNKS